MEYPQHATDGVYNMTDFLVTGKKRNGKSLVCVSRIKDAILQGRRIATNLDLFLEPMLGPFHRTARVIRLPDHPSADDLWALGQGYDGDELREERNGLLVLDELATWLNSRSFSDKGRQAVLDYLAQSGKERWDTYLLAQHQNQIDKQVREALVDYLVVCRRMDRMKVGPVRLPKSHIAFVRWGLDQNAPISERWWYRGTDLYKAYNTEQKFRSDCGFGAHSLLPPWNLDGFKREKPGLRYHLFGTLPPYRRQHQIKPKRPEVVAAMRLPPEHRIRVMNAAALPLASAGGPA